MNATYQLITDQIIADLQKGKIAWRKDWATRGLPRNYISKQPYSGINMFLLSIDEKYTSREYLTFNQVNQLGGHVLKGEKAQRVIFWKVLDIKEAEEDKTIPFLKYYYVFNLEQTTIKPKIITREFNPIDEAEKIISGYLTKPEIQYKGDKAFFNTKTDYIQMPPKETFKSDAGYYATMFHELTHSTGHKSRLNRFTEETNLDFGKEDYSKEELIAEMGSAFLCAIAGISNEVIENQTAYIQNWLTALKNDNTLVIKASAKANKAVKYIINKEIELKVH